MNASASDFDLLDEIRQTLRTQVRELSFEIPDTQMTGGVKVRIPLDAHASTVLDANVRELDAWALQLRAEAARLRRQRWRPHYVGGTLHVALCDPNTYGDDGDVIEVDKTRYGSLARAREECIARNRLRREEMSA